MQTVEGVVGDATFRVVLPDGLPAAWVTLSLRPQTAAEFEDTITALGGVQAFSFPETEGYWDDPAARVDDGSVVLVYPPPASAVAGVSGHAVKPHPFFGQYVERKAAGS